MSIVDMNGRFRPLTGHQVHVTLVIGWVSFLLSWMFNIMYYRAHPSAVDFHPSRSRARLFIYILGQRIELPGYRAANFIDDKLSIRRADTTVSLFLPTCDIWQMSHFLNHDIFDIISKPKLSTLKAEHRFVWFLFWHLEINNNADNARRWNGK